jgi:thiosulfate dehydrogenase [quinone] large subunit
MIKENNYSGLQLFALVGARVLIGWYCLYEGVVKFINPNWSSFAFLNDSQGWFAQIFIKMASNPVLVSVIDFLNVWGLIAIGCGLIIGLLARYAIIAGIIIISLYCLSHPSLIEANYLLSPTDNSMWVGKNIIFVFLFLILLVFPTSQIIGIDRLLFSRRK